MFMPDYQYVKVDPIFNAKQVYLGHMTWVRAVANNPTPKQQQLLTWLIETDMKTQKLYVIVDDELVKSPTKRILWRKTATEWVKQGK